MRSLDAQLYPEKLKAIAQQVQEQQAQTQSLVHLQQHKQPERDLTPAHSPQVGNICIRVWLTHKQWNPFENYARVLTNFTFICAVWCAKSSINISRFNANGSFWTRFDIGMSLGLLRPVVKFRGFSLNMCFRNRDKKLDLSMGCGSIDDNDTEVCLPTFRGKILNLTHRQTIFSSVYFENRCLFWAR